MKNTRDVYDDLLDMAKREANHKSLPTDVIFRVFNTVDSGLLSFLKDGKTVLYVYSNKHGSGDYNIGTPDIEKWMALAFAAAGHYINDFTNFICPSYEEFLDEMDVSEMTNCASIKNVSSENDSIINVFLKIDTDGNINDIKIRINKA
jgi:hypothetical protein